MIKRKELIAGMAAAVAAPPLGATVLQSSTTLQAAAARNGRFFGSAVQIAQIDTEKDLRETVLRECLMLVPEFEMNWNQLEGERGRLNFDGIDRLAAFAQGNGKKVRGHTLLWHLGTPQWVIDELRTQQDWNIVARYFGSVIPRYGDVISQWEVVNEPMDPGYRADGLRGNAFLNAFGPDYIQRALEQARVFAPHGQLLINEFGLEYDLPDERSRRYLLLKLLERLKQAKAPIDALGVQAHLDLRKGHISASSIAKFFQAVADLGLPIYVTELDVKEADYVASPEERDRLVADEVRRYLDVALRQRRVNGVTTWGLSDRHSWLLVTPDDYARFAGAWTKGSGPGFNRGLPFDSSMRPKPMYYALRDALWNVRAPGQMR